MIRLPRLFLGIFAGVVAGGGLAMLIPVAATESPLPTSVTQAIEKLADRNNVALSVKQAGVPWIVGVGRGRASPKVVQGMERDNATRAAVDVAKNEIAQLLEANISEFTDATTSQLGEARVDRDVVVTVMGMVLSRVELHDAKYDEVSRECRVVVICPPASKDDRCLHVYKDARTAAVALLKKTCAGVCHTGVISVPVNRRGGGEPRLVAIAITAGPKSQAGGREISRSKGLAALARFVAERIDSQDTLHRESKTFVDPFDPDGSRVLYSERFERQISISQAGVLPPTATESTEAGDVLYTATWFADAD